MVKTVLDILRGSVRPLVTLVFAGALVVGFFLDRIPADAFLGAVTLALGFWFGSRKPS